MDTFVIAEIVEIVKVKAYLSREMLVVVWFVDLMVLQCWRYESGKTQLVLLCSFSYALDKSSTGVLSLGMHFSVANYMNNVSASQYYTINDVSTNTVIILLYAWLSCQLTLSVYLPLGHWILNITLFTLTSSNRLTWLCHWFLDYCSRHVTSTLQCNAPLFKQQGLVLDS